MGRREHWEQVYAGKPSERLGWYKPQLQTSLEWISAIGLDRGAPVIDVGGGASTLVDDLLDLGYTSITVLDLAAPALELIKARIGRRSSSVTWICGDITEFDLPDNAFEVWHDRAVFHFLTEVEDRERYCENLRPRHYRHVRAGSAAEVQWTSGAALRSRHAPGDARQRFRAAATQEGTARDAGRRGADVSLLRVSPRVSGNQRCSHSG